MCSVTLNSILISFLAMGKISVDEKDHYAGVSMQQYMRLDALSFNTFASKYKIIIYQTKQGNLLEKPLWCLLESTVSSITQKIRAF